MVTVTIIRYPRRHIFFALLAMAVHRLPLALNKRISFSKLMGSGRNGSFDKQPDWQQWAILCVHTSKITPASFDQPSLLRRLYGPFIAGWYRFFHCECWTVFLDPVAGHGKWDGREPFGKLPRHADMAGTLSVLTRATIRFSGLRGFWKEVDGVSDRLSGAPGFINSFGIGEIPFIKQATLSTWSDAAAMKAFAYATQEHADVVRKTRSNRWYSEELFVRFRPWHTAGTIHGVDPLAGKL